MATAKITAVADLQTKGFEVGLAKMNQGVQRFAGGQLKQLSGMIGASFAIRSVVDFTRTQTAAADATANLSRNLGISTEALQALEVSAEKYGGTVEQISTALIALRRRQGAALAGNTGYQKAFERLNISLDDLKKLDTPQLLERVAKGYKDAGQSAKALDAVDQALSESGRRLLGTLVDIADNGLQKLIDQGIKTGAVLRDDVTQELAAANNQLEITERRLKNIATIGLARVIAALKDPASIAKAISGGAQGTISALVEQTFSGKALKKSAAERKAKKGIDIDLGDESATPNAGKMVSIKATDQLAKIGGILGGQAMSSAERTAKDSLNIQRNMDQKLSMIADTSKRTSENTTSLKED